MTLPRDISRCTGSKCREREECLRYLDVPRTGVVSFFDASEMEEAKSESLGCRFKIDP